MKRLILSLLSISAGCFWISDVHAQVLANCQVPENNQYALLVNPQAANDQSRLEQVLPSTASITRCVYGNQEVIQVETFADAELAQSWAEYLNTVEGFQTVVLNPDGRVSAASTPTSTPSPQSTQADFPSPSTAASPATSPSPTPVTPAYAPAVLEPGYAVLVRYNNQPEVAAAVQSVLNSAVGLAVYEQQPYLLVAYSTDPRLAGQVLQGLSDRQFDAFIVSSQRVVVLSSTVTVP
jgi:hypothetical protein